MHTKSHVQLATFHLNARNVCEQNIDHLFGRSVVTFSLNQIFLSEIAFILTNAWFMVVLSFRKWKWINLKQCVISDGTMDSIWNEYIIQTIYIKVETGTTEELNHTLRFMTWKYLLKEMPKKGWINHIYLHLTSYQNYLHVFSDWVLS